MSTVVTANAYTPNFTARPVILSNGWIVTAVKNGTTSIILYVSKDGGVTFTHLCYKTANQAGFTICSTGTTVWLMYGNNATVNVVKFDATTVTNVDLTGEVTIATIGGTISVCSIAFYSASVLTAAWQGVTPGSQIAICTAKTTDGGETWTKQDDTSGYDILDQYTSTRYAYPYAIYGSDGYPKISYCYIGGVMVYVKSWNGTSWGATTPWSGAGTIDSTYLLIKKSGSNVGRVFLAFNLNNVGTIRYTDDGINWYAPTIGTVMNSTKITLAENPSGDIIAMYAYGTDIKYQTCDDGTTTFDTETSITTTAESGGHVAIMDYHVNQMIWYLWGTSTNVQADRFMYNVAPLAPTLTAKAAFDADAASTFYWAYNDPNAWDTQGAYQLQIIRVSDAAVVVDSGKVSSATSAYTLTAATLTNAVAYQWKVKTWDALDTEGPYSSLGSFTTSAAPTVAITYPAADVAVHPYSAISAQWTVSDPQGSGQSAYQVRLTDSADTELWDSTKTADVNARSKTVDYVLENAGSYKLKITAWNASDIASAETVRTFTVSYTAPATPTITATAQNGYIAIAITNPEPTGSEPTVVTNDLYRRISGATAWERIKTGIANNGSYSDYAVASAVTYEYKVRANGDNDTTADSATASTSISLSGVWLHDVASPAATVKQLRADGGGRQIDWQSTAALLQFDGRTFPVAEFGDTETGSVSTTIQLTRASGDLAVLEALVQRKATLCYRDGRGRKVFGVITSLPVAEERSWGYTVTVRVDRVDYTEVV